MASFTFILFSPDCSRAKSQHQQEKSESTMGTQCRRTHFGWSSNLVGPAPVQYKQAVNTRLCSVSQRLKGWALSHCPRCTFPLMFSSSHGKLALDSLFIISASSLSTSTGNAQSLILQTSPLLSKGLQDNSCVYRTIGYLNCLTALINF